MLEKAKAALRWVYDWMTVLAASLVGLPSLLLQAISLLDGVDITPFLPPEYALKIVTGIGITKAILALLESWMKKKGA